MKKYRVNVNGSLYEIEIEEMAAPAKMSAAAPAAAPAAVPAAAPAPAGAGAQVKAPMPGTILDVKVQAGQSVKKGDVLVILEAMKMETTITAPIAGAVGTIYVTKGQAIMSGDCLLEIR